MSQTSPIPVRGFMLDISRDRVPTRESLELLVDLLQACHYNQLELYTEHTFAHQGHEVVWQDASPITADDMAWLDELCRGKGIALVANRNSLGHMERFLKHPEYAHRAELPEGFDMWGSHHEPSTVAITDDNLAFVNSLVEELVATTTTKAVNIGMDEPWEFGQGASKELVQREGQGKVYTDWVLDVAKPWLDNGYRVEMWGDILGHHPEQASRLPEGMALVIWGYDSPEYIRVTRERAGMEVPEAPGFADMVAPFTERGKDLWVAPGTGVWNSVVGRLECAVPNIIDSVHSAANVGSEGFLLTSWGDNGHWEGYVHCLVPIIVGGFASYDPSRAHELDDLGTLTDLTSRVLFGAPGNPGAELLVRTGYLASKLNHPVENSTALFHALQGKGPEMEISSEAFKAAQDEVADLLELAGQLPRAGWVDEVCTSLRLTQVALDRLQGTDTAIDEELVAEVRSNWLATSRPGGLDDSLAHLRGVEQAETGDVPVTQGHYAGLLGR